MGRNSLFAVQNKKINCVTCAWYKVDGTTEDQQNTLVITAI